MPEDYAEYGGYEGEQESPGISADQTIKRQISVVRRHIRIVIAAFLIVSTFGLFRAYKAIPIYEARSKVMIEKQAPRVTKFEGVVQPNVGWWGKEYYKTQEELVRSRAVLELALKDDLLEGMFAPGQEVSEPRQKSLVLKARETVASLLGIPPPTPSEPWERLRGHISAKHIPDTHFMRVSAESSDKVKARKMAAAVADAFVRYHTLRRMEISNDVFLYLQKQKEREEESLRSAEQRLQEFREETQISSLDATDSDHPVLKRLTLLNEQLTQTELQTIELESEIRVVKEAVQHGGRTLQPENEQLFSMPSIRDDATVMSVREALVSANEELARLQDVYGPEHPRYQSAKGTLDMLRERLTSALGEITGSLEARLAAFENKENKLRSEYEEQQTLAMDLARQSLAFSHLQNEVERHRKLYEVLVARMSEVELTSDYTRTNVEVVEEAALPKNPVRPNKRRMATTSLILGLIVGLGLAFVVEHVDDTVRTPDDLEVRVGIPVLGFVPRIEMKGKENEGASYRALICAKEPTSSAIEAYRNIRTAIFFSIPAEEAKILLVTSGGPAAGKTTTAANLATIIAQSGKRVLLVDADFRRPMVHHIFGLSQERGLSSVLVGEAGFDESVQKSMENLEVLENLDLLSSGPKPANPTELLETRSMRKFLAAMREKYDRVIIDLPPVLFVSDAAILGAQADGVVLVVRSGKSTCAHASRARKQIEKVKGRIIGGILNDVKVTRLGHYYSDYFYHGYSRYYHDYYSSYYGQSRDRKEGRPRSSRKKKEEEAAV